MSHRGVNICPLGSHMADSDEHLGCQVEHSTEHCRENIQTLVHKTDIESQGGHPSMAARSTVSLEYSEIRDEQL